MTPGPILNSQGTESVRNNNNNSELHFEKSCVCNSLLHILIFLMIHCILSYHLNVENEPIALQYSVKITL